MELFDEKFNEICAKYTLAHFVKGGLILKPTEIKRSIKNRAKELGVPAKEMAEAYKILYTSIFNKTLEKIEDVISGKVEE